MKEFKVGDKVVYDLSDEYDPFSFSPSGLTGIVVCIDADGFVGVNFKDFTMGHNFCGRIEGSSGWWCSEDSLTLKRPAFVINKE